MNQPYQILLDIWEGNPDVDVDVLQEHNVVGLIVRLNDMRGGHHMDDMFERNWALAKLFPVQTLYFVYNPWVDGQANYNWLISHLPADFGRRRIMVDIEVKYLGYSPETYAREVEAFIGLVQQRYPGAIYTGGWFLPIIARWPKDIDYWWAAYPYKLTASKTWAEYKKALEIMVYQAFTRFSPGPARLWQCTGDGVRLEGFGNHAVDVNVYPGTLDDLAAWLGMPGPVAELPEEPPISEETPVSEEAHALTMRVTASVLNVRSGPGFNYSIVGSLRAGDQVELRDVGGPDAWVLTEYGWACAQNARGKYMKKA